MSITLTSENDLATHLRGKFFTRNDVTGLIECSDVAGDFIPRHSAKVYVPSATARIPFTPEQDAIIVAMKMEHKTWEQICRVVGRGVTLTSDRWRDLCRINGWCSKSIGSSKKPLWTRWSAEKRAEIEGLYEQRLTRKAICRKAGVSNETLLKFERDCMTVKS